MLRALVSAALVLLVTSALPLRALARGPILSSCQEHWKGFPEGGSRLGEKLAGFSEAMAMYEDGSTSDKSGSTCTRAGENGLDRAAPKALTTSAAARNTWLQLYKDYGTDRVYADAFDSETIKGAAKAELVTNKYQAGGVHALHAIEQTVASVEQAPMPGTTMPFVAPDATKGGGSANELQTGIDVLDVASAGLPLVPGTILMLAARDATKGGVDEEEAAQSFLVWASWGLFQFLAILVCVVFMFGWISVCVVFIFGWVVPRCSSSAKGAAWRSSVVGYLLISPEIALVAAETSVRGRSGRSDDNTKSKTKTSGSLAQRRALTGYVMDDDNIRTAVAAWDSDAATAEAMYGHISTWATGALTDMPMLFCVRQSWMEGESWADNCVLLTSSFNENIGAWDTSGVTTMDSMFWGASAFDQDIGAWDTSGVTDMGGMFGYAKSFNHPLGDWRVDKVTNMGGMFNGAMAFNQDISGWAIQSVTDMSSMFYEASAFDQDLGWCVDDDVSLEGAFSETPCELTSCGVTQVVPTSSPTAMPTPTTFPASRPASRRPPLRPRRRLPASRHPSRPPFLRSRRRLPASRRLAATRLPSRQPTRPRSGTEGTCSSTISRAVRLDMSPQPMRRTGSRATTRPTTSI